MLDTKNKTVISNVIGAFVIKGGALIVSLFTMPAYIKYFNNQEVLGVWFTMLSVLSWILSFDLGIGNGLRNKLVFAIDKNDRPLMKKYITSALISITGVVVGIMIIGTTIIPFIPWSDFFKIGGVISNDVIVIAMLICFVGIMLQFIFNIVNSIYYALQLSAVNNLLALVTSVAELICVLLIKVDAIEQKLIIMSIVYVCCMLLPLIVAGIIIFATQLRDCLPSLKCFSKECAKQVVTMGGVFFYCQFAHLLICPVNQIIITSLYGPEFVVDFQIYHKLFTLPSMLVMLAITPLWSMVTKALAEGDYKWMKKLFAKLEIVIAVVAVIMVVMVLACQPIINLWLQDEAIEVDPVCAAVFGIIGLTVTYNSVVNTFANGVGHLKTQAILMTCMVVIKYILTFTLHNYLPWISVIAINAGLFSVYCVIMHIRVRMYIRKKDIDINDTFRI